MGHPGWHGQRHNARGNPGTRQREGLRQPQRGPTVIPWARSHAGYPPPRGRTGSIAVATGHTVGVNQLDWSVDHEFGCVALHTASRGSRIF